MGPGQTPLMYRSCPVGTSLQDDEITLLLASYNIKDLLGIVPPGRQNPRVLDAWVVIRSENNAIDRERMSK